MSHYCVKQVKHPQDVIEIGIHEVHCFPNGVEIVNEQPEKASVCCNKSDMNEAEMKMQLKARLETLIKALDES